MPIEIKRKSSLTTISVKLPSRLKDELARISSHEGISPSDTIRSFLEFALSAYEEGKVLRVGDEEFMKRFRATLKPGDIILANGLVGTITRLKPEYADIEIAPGINVTVLKESITDILNPEDNPKLPSLGTA